MLSTGSLEMSVYQMSSDGKIGQLATVAAGPRGADSGADVVGLSDCPVSRPAGPDEAGPDEAAVLGRGECRVWRRRRGAAGRQRHRGEREQQQRAGVETGKYPQSPHPSDAGTAGSRMTPQ